MKDCNRKYKRDNAENTKYIMKYTAKIQELDKK